MALHGTVNVNRDTVVAWHAVRITNLHAVTPDTVNEYKCVVTIPNEPTRTFYVTHRYGDGAHVLASKVLRCFDYVLKGEIDYDSPEEVAG